MSRAVSFLCLAFFSAVYAAAETITATIFADNFFEFYVDGVLIKSDPIDFTPHQAVTFTFTATSGVSRQYAIKANDYATDSGYEYVNTTSPQLGDGSLRILLSDGTVSSTDWKCMTTSYGPTQESIDAGCSSTNLDACELSYTDVPDGWTLSTFDDSDWDYATLYTEQEAGQCSTVTDPYTGKNQSPPYALTTADECIDPKQVSWGKASFIWHGDLDYDNTILCRYTYK